MENLLKGLLKYRVFVMAVFILLVGVSLFMMQGIVVNYDLVAYLPEDAMTKRAIIVMEDAFDYPGMADVMLENVTILEAKKAKEIILSIPGIKNAIWLDDIMDITLPESFIPQRVMNNYYMDNAALFRVEFSEGNYAIQTGRALEQIRAVFGDAISISGPAENSRFMREVLAKEIFMIFLVVFPLCVIILMFASHSWVEPFIYLLVIGISVAINMGTNVIFPSISFLTKSIAALLQFAISMDYSLFLSHRYIEERGKGIEVIPAIIGATRQSLSSIASSALTTIAGFLALIFMQYTIGKDLGLVLAKGIVISFVCVIVLMPVLLMTFHKTIDKTRHKSLIPPFNKLGAFIVKQRYIVIIIAILVIIPSFLAQRSNHFLYGDNSGSSSQGIIAEERVRIEERFGIYNPIMVLVPRGNIPLEMELVKALQNLEAIRDVQALVTMADPSIPVASLPQRVQDMFLSEQYSRIIVGLKIAGETPEIFDAVASVKATLQRYYPDEWLSAGVSTSIVEISETVENDTLAVSLFSILAVGLIVMLTFRSISIPVILVTVIQASIWINMGIPYFQGSSLVFIGFLVVSAIQLGATIDYGILVTNRYIDFRRIQTPKDAVISSLNSAGSSVLISALVLAIAGFAEGMLSQISSISEIGILLGRGAILSGLLVLILLPMLLITFDKVIMKTTMGTQ